MPKSIGAETHSAETHRAGTHDVGTLDTVYSRCGNARSEMVLSVKITIVMGHHDLVNAKAKVKYFSQTFL